MTSEKHGNGSAHLKGPDDEFTQKVKVGDQHWTELYLLRYGARFYLLKGAEKEEKHLYMFLAPVTWFTPELMQWCFWRWHKLKLPPGVAESFIEEAAKELALDAQTKDDLIEEAKLMSDLGIIRRKMRDQRGLS